MPASRTLEEDLLPVGLAHGVKVGRDIPMGAFVKASDVHLDEENLAVGIRRDMVRISRSES